MKPMMIIRLEAVRAINVLLCFRMSSLSLRRNKKNLTWWSASCFVWWHQLVNIWIGSNLLPMTQDEKYNSESDWPLLTNCVLILFRPEKKNKKKTILFSGKMKMKIDLETSKYTKSNLLDKNDYLIFGGLRILEDVMSGHVRCLSAANEEYIHWIGKP